MKQLHKIKSHVYMEKQKTSLSYHSLKGLQGGYG